MHVFCRLPLRAGNLRSREPNPLEKPQSSPLTPGLPRNHGSDSDMNATMTESPTTGPPRVPTLALNDCEWNSGACVRLNRRAVKRGLDPVGSRLHLGAGRDSEIESLNLVLFLTVSTSAFSFGRPATAPLSAAL